MTKLVVFDRYRFKWAIVMAICVIADICIVVSLVVKHDLAWLWLPIASGLCCASALYDAVLHSCRIERS